MCTATMFRVALSGWYCADGTGGNENIMYNIKRNGTNWKIHRVTLSSLVQLGGNCGRGTRTNERDGARRSERASEGVRERNNLPLGRREIDCFRLPHSSSFPFLPLFLSFFRKTMGWQSGRTAMRGRARAGLFNPFR